MNNGHSFQTKYATEAYAESRDLWDKPIFESESFVAVPTVGALVEGWLLVVPKIFELSFARLPSRQLSELDEFLEEIVPSMESAYGSVSVFEHGAAAANNLIGCGVDYAHLHLVPNRCDLLKAAQKIAPNRRIAPGQIEIKASVSVPVTRNSIWTVQTAQERIENLNGKIISGGIKGQRIGGQWNYEVSVLIDDTQLELKLTNDKIKPTKIKNT